MNIAVPECLMRLFDEQYLMSSVAEPVREGWAGNADAVNGYAHLELRQPGVGFLGDRRGQVAQAGQAALEEPLDPLADMLLGQADQAGHGDQGGPLGDFEDGPASPGQAQRGRGTTKGLQELIVFLRG